MLKILKTCWNYVPSFGVWFELCDISKSSNRQPYYALDFSMQRSCYIYIQLYWWWRSYFYYFVEQICFKVSAFPQYWFLWFWLIHGALRWYCIILLNKLVSKVSAGPRLYNLMKTWCHWYFESDVQQNNISTWTITTNKTIYYAVKNDEQVYDLCWLQGTG